MLSLGRISETTNEAVSRESFMGFEFSGVKRGGERVMGIGVNAGALSTHYDANNAILWNVPDSWTLEEAATVPLVYFTVYFAFFNTTTIKAGKKILIHSGSGGVGQAAIEIAIAYGLEVFTTVSTEEKKNFLLKRLPKLKAENIGNSRNITFEKMVLENTQGKGVDYVLNSLSGEKLKASIRCLGVDGVFLEIGKYDIQMGTNLDMSFLKKRITIKAVIFDDLAVDSDEMQNIYKIVEKDIKSGIIRPLKTTVFNADKIEDAFRFMTSGKHIGKVLLKIRKNENDECSLPLIVLKRVYYDLCESVIIVGGLGGFGIELSGWLISRGCTKLILNSRKGIRNSDQALKIKLWSSLGIKVVVNTADITTEQGCENLIKEASNLGPVGAIFNLAAVLRDGIFENLNQQMFNESLAPKALGTKYLDKVSRIMCPNLKHFVVFSSVSCGRGNAGQSNYGMANSVMERIIEKRHQDELPAKAIQWGAIGDVGMLADFQLANMNKDVGGTTPQSIYSCLEALDVLLTVNDPVVSSMIVANKKLNDAKKGNIIDMVFKVMGIRDRKLVSMNSTLTQLGIDSLTGVEIQQIIEREFNVSLTSQQLRSFTLSQLEKRVLSKNLKNDSKKDLSNKNDNDEITSAEKAKWMTILMEDVMDANTVNLVTSETIVKANYVHDMSTIIVIIPGLNGYASKVYHNLAKEMKYSTFILQLVNTSECKNIDEIMNIIAPDILKLYLNAENFVLIGHSFGALLTLKIAKLLEENGKSGQIIQLDGSPEFCSKFASQSFHEENFSDVKNYTSMILFKFYQKYIDPKIWKSAFENHKSWENRFKELKTASKDKIPVAYDVLMNYVSSSYVNRQKIALEAKNESFYPLKATNISLIKPTKTSVKELPADYGLSKFSTSEVIVKLISGDHVTILENPELASFINQLIINDKKTDNYDK